MNPTIMMSPMGLMFSWQQQYWEMANRFMTSMVPAGQAGRQLNIHQRSDEQRTDVRQHGETKTHENSGEQVIGIGEEYLDVSTRKIEGQATRIRRTVREVPVERHVRLEDETITIERRPSNGHPIDGDVMSEREYVVTDTREVPVITKGMRLREEIVVHRKVNRRSETVSDRLKQTDVEVIQPQRAMVKV